MSCGRISDCSRRSAFTSAPRSFRSIAWNPQSPGTSPRAPDGRYVVLNPGAAWPTKRWPAVAARPPSPPRCATDTRCRRSCVWGPGEESLARDVVAASAGAAILSPPTSIADLVALSRGAALFVSGDTGPAHIAAAVGTPIVGIYGPTRPSRNGPWSPDDVTVSRDGVCQCHHLRRCRLETMCLTDIQVDEVPAAVERRLAGARRA